jgi:hypothetical protein
LAATCSETLRSAPDIQEQLAHCLGVGVATISRLAEEGSLGFSAERGGMTVHTPGGIQVRANNGAKHYIKGSQQDVWRGHAARSAAHVILTEGASDAIAVIDAGLEDDGTTAVLALPSATTSFREPGIGVLEGKNVTLIPDRDGAGHGLARKAAVSLVPIVGSLRIFSWQLVREQRPNLNNDVKDVRELYAILGAEATAGLIQTCSQAVDPDDSSSGGCCSTTDDDIPVEPLSSSFPDVMIKEVKADDELIQHGFPTNGAAEVRRG